jgi:hypothetical protein
VVSNYLNKPDLKRYKEDLISESSVVYAVTFIRIFQMEDPCSV